MTTLLWTLLFIQIAMGAFDTIYHHELTERLPWRPSQERDLALHAVRNLLYAAVFIMIGWFEAHGVWAFMLMTILVVEVVITLIDFVEEDLSRVLPASERINHTLLAVNYGAILCLLIPRLLQWSRDATALRPAFYGFWSILMALSTMAVVVAGLRDYFASRRAGHLVTGRAAELVVALPETPQCPHHRSHRLHRQPLGGSTRRRRPSGHHPGALPGQGRQAQAPVPARRVARWNPRRRTNRHGRQSRR
jgi:uncharacterized protein